MTAAVLKDFFRKLRLMKKSPACATTVKDRGSSSSAPGPPPPPVLLSSGWLQEDLHRVFSLFDRNGDGKISADELEAMVCAIGNVMATHRDDSNCNNFNLEAAMMMEVADLDGDGFIDFQEFSACVAQKATPTTPDADCRQRSYDDEDLKLAFAVYDLNGDGVITAEELHHVLRRVMPGIDDGNGKTLADCRNMIKAVDRDGDGTVCFGEFVAMMTPAAATC